MGGWINGNEFLLYATEKLTNRPYISIGIKR